MFFRLRSWLLRRRYLFCVPCEPQDMQSGACPVGAVDQSAVVDLNIVSLDRAFARGGDFGIALRMADSIRAEEHSVLVRRRNEIGHLLHGKGVANIKNARARIKPGKDCQLPVVGWIKRFSHCMRSEPPAPAAIVSRVFRHAEGRNGPWRSLNADVEEEGQMRCRTGSIRIRCAVVASRSFRGNDQEISLFQRRMALEFGNRYAKH